MSIPKHHKTPHLRNFSGVQSEKVVIDPYNKNSFSTNSDKIQFRFPRTGILDADKSFIKYNINVTGGSSDHAYSPFYRWKLWIGNVVADESIEFARQMTLNMDAYLNSDEVASSSIKRIGYRITNSDSTTVTKYMPLSDRKFWKYGFLQKLPLYKLAQVRLELEIYSDINVWTSGDASAFLIDEVKLNCHLDDSEALRSQWANEVKGSYITMEPHVRNVANASTSINELVPCHYNDVLGVIIEQQLDSVVDVGTTALNYNWTSNHTLNSANNVEVFIDGQRFPKHAIETNNTYDIGDIVQNLEEFWSPNSGRLGDVIHNYADKSDESAMYFAIPLGVNRKTISGMKLSDKSGTLTVKSSLSASASTTLTVWVAFRRFYRIASNGAFSIIE